MWFPFHKSRSRQLISDALEDARAIRRAAEADATTTRATATVQCSEISRTLEALLKTSAKADEVLRLAVEEAARVRSEAYAKLTAADILEFLYARIPQSGPDRLAALEAARLGITTRLKEAYDAYRAQVHK